MIGDGEYNMNILTEIKTTDPYLGLDQNIKKCQSTEALNNCTTRQYLNALLNQCRCLPLNLRLSEKVFHESTNLRHLQQKLMQIHVLGATVQFI